MFKFTPLCLCLLLVLCTFVNALPKGAIEATGHTIGYGELEEEWRGEVIHLSWAPRAFYLKNFLSEEECDHLVAKAKPRMKKSRVVNSQTGTSVDSEARTSTGMFFGKAEDDVITKIEKRVAQVSMIPVENQEGMQVLEYVDGQRYTPHFDYFHDTVNARSEMGGQRVVTILMYLSTPDEGGETVFPKAEGPKSTGSHWSPCALEGLAVKAIKGDALMFYSLKPDGSMDTTSLHESCPALKGEKWSATKWIRVGPIGGAKAKVNNKQVFDNNCKDDHEQCSEWAFFGECEKNPSFMNDACKKSCKLCGPAGGTTV